MMILIAALAFVCSFLFMLTSDDREAVGFGDGLGVFNNIIFGKLSLLIVVFLLFVRYMNVRNRSLGYMAKISFGVFFVQGFFMLVFQKLIQSTTTDHPALVVASEVTFVLGGSILAVAILKKILGNRSRYVIGC
jgi:hypothetical protein